MRVRSRAQAFTESPPAAPRWLFRVFPAALLLVLASACGPEGEPENPDAGPPLQLAFATEVVDVQIGPGGGFGEDALPGVVLGPPNGGGERSGSRDVVSLGLGGSITVRLGAPCFDEAGPDLLVFENPFLFGTAVFSEPGAVEVSRDGIEFFAFACAPEAPAPNGCAGMTPVLSNVANAIDPFDLEKAGGDAFDLRDIFVDATAPASVSYIRITDVGGVSGDDGISGFDLDAVACVTGVE